MAAFTAIAAVSESEFSHHDNIRSCRTIERSPLANVSLFFHLPASEQRFPYRTPIFNGRDVEHRACSKLSNGIERCGLSSQLTRDQIAPHGCGTTSRLASHLDNPVGQIKLLALSASKRIPPACVVGKIEKERSPLPTASCANLPILRGTSFISCKSEIFKRVMRLSAKAHHPCVISCNGVVLKRPRSVGISSGSM